MLNSSPSVPAEIPRVLTALYGAYVLQPVSAAATAEVAEFSFGETLVEITGQTDRQDLCVSQDTRSHYSLFVIPVG